MPDTLDLSLIPPRRRTNVVALYQREVVAVLAGVMYPEYLTAHGSENAPAEIAAALVADGHPAEVCTARFVRSVIREGR